MMERNKQAEETMEARFERLQKRFDDLEKQVEKKFDEAEFVEGAPVWDGPYDLNDDVVHTFKSDIVKLMIWYAHTEGKNEKLKPKSKRLLWKIIFLAYLTLLVQCFFSVTLQTYALENADPCEEACLLSEDQCT